MTEIISVRFHNGSKSYYFAPQGLLVQPGQFVVVETAQGLAYGQCTEGNREASDQEIIPPLRNVVRLATEQDHKTAASQREREKEVFAICQRRIAAHRLEMKLVRAECNFEGSKITFYFTAEGRVDFRDLVRDLANTLRSRIELRQIGVRDEAKLLGGLGICGRPLCCSQFLDDFVPVSIKMVKTQSVSLNPSKTSGACGRLMCCFKYEQDAYEEAARRLPRAESFVNTPDGVGDVQSVNLLREEVAVRLDSTPESSRRYKVSEIEVLRPGKGSREGIEVPSRRPERHQNPDEPAGARHFGETVLPEGERPLSPSEDRRRNKARESYGKPERNAKSGKPDKTGPERAIPLRSVDVTAAKKAAADRVYEDLEAERNPKNRTAGSRRKCYRRPRGKG